MRSCSALLDLAQLNISHYVTQCNLFSHSIFGSFFKLIENEREKEMKRDRESERANSAQ